ncbi:MAG: ABC transporter ATP-binding protein [Candidatus Nanopelagicales bacterium]
MAEVFTGIGLTVRRGDSLLLDDVNWSVSEGERWVVIGPNGAGKTTLLSILAGRMFPTSGLIEVLGEELGATDMAELRTRIGWASSGELIDLPPGESVANAVMTGAQAVAGRWIEEYDPADEARRDQLLLAWDLTHLAKRTFGTLSEGERKRCLIARSLMADPELLLLDEPGAGLDLAGREDLVERLENLAEDPMAPGLILITHHVEEIPPGFTHALVISHGRVVASGPIGSVLTGHVLSAAFAFPIEVSCDNGRYFARRSRA